MSSCSSQGSWCKGASTNSFRTGGTTTKRSRRRIPCGRRRRRRRPSRLPCPALSGVYQYGQHGVPQDLAKALQCYEKSAAKGHEVSKARVINITKQLQAAAEEEEEEARKGGKKKKK
eukprot:scaffold25490_cov33-Prasinocladus_malaysianus.AAC.1